MEIKAKSNFKINEDGSIEITGGKFEKGKVSDGYHTFDELYYHRMILFSVICNTYKNIAWKSWKHFEGDMFEDYFIVGINTPEGAFTYHYHKDFWGMFNVPEIDRAVKWDGHTADDITRLLSLLDVKGDVI